MGADGPLPPDPFAEAKTAIVATAMAQLEESAIFDLMASYKAHMIDAGFSSDAAEQMAVDYHRGIVNA